jgi:hypothetical protein
MGLTIYLDLFFIGVVLGFVATLPDELRLLRQAQMLLSPILLCCIARACLKFGRLFPDKALSAVILVSAIVGTVVTFAPNFIWLFRSLTHRTDFQFEGRYIDEEEHLQPIRNLVEAEQYPQALERLETLLKTHRPDFPALHLLAQLYHKLNKNKRAERCLLFMIRSASTDEERLDSSRLYHQLTTT